MWGESPSRRLGFDKIFSPFICWKIDSGLTQYKLWYDARFQARKKVGKYGQEAKYKTLSDVLGLHQEKQHGTFNNAAELEDTANDYIAACAEAKKAGLPNPDITEWLKSRGQQDEPPDETPYDLYETQA